jgi:hypothetical protein
MRARYTRAVPNGKDRSLGIAELGPILRLTRRFLPGRRRPLHRRADGLNHELRLTYQRLRAAAPTLPPSPSLASNLDAPTPLGRCERHRAHGRAGHGVLRCCACSARYRSRRCMMAWCCTGDARRPPDGADAALQSLRRLDTAPITAQPVPSVHRLVSVRSSRRQAALAS